MPVPQSGQNFVPGAATLPQLGHWAIWVCGLLDGFAGLFEGSSQAEDIGDALQSSAGLLAARFRDLISAGRIFIAGSGLLVKIGDAYELAAGGALAEILVDLVPMLVELLGIQIIGGSRVIAVNAIGDGIAQDRDSAEEPTHGILANVAGDRTPNIGSTAIFATALVAIKNRIRS